MLQMHFYSEGMLDHDSTVAQLACEIFEFFCETDSLEQPLTKETTRTLITLKETGFILLCLFNVGF